MAGTRTRAEREALVEAAASAVAEQYAEIVPVPSFGMVFEGYFTGGAGHRSSRRSMKSSAHARRSTNSPATR